MSLKRYIWLLAAVALSLAWFPALVSARPAEQQGQNLLVNSGFEGGWHWQGDGFLGKITDFEGNLLQSVEAPEGGVVLFLVTSMATNRQDPLIAIGA